MHGSRKGGSHDCQTVRRRARALPAVRARICTGRKTHRSADRAYCLHGRPARYRGGEAGAREIEEQGSARVRQ